MGAAKRFLGAALGYVYNSIKGGLLAQIWISCVHKKHLKPTSITGNAYPNANCQNFKSNFL